MHDTQGRIIYVGKATNLRARVRAYLSEQDTRYSVKFLMKRVARIAFLVTATEKEALLLENSLIKEHRPRYNVRLKDDKTYVSLRFNVQDDFPRITVVRRYKKDGAKYFGPFSSAQAVRETIRQIHRVFPLRTCTDNVLYNRTRPCLYYQMKQCGAPCVNLISRDDYHAVADQVVMVLEGRSGELEKLLQRQIQEHAEKLEFEKAAELRDRLYALRKTLERQHTVGVAGAEDRDVFGLFTQGRYTEIQVLFFRGGKMLGGRSYSFKHREMPVDEVLSSFILQYYSESSTIPREILVPLALEEAAVLGEILTEQRGGRVTLHAPQRGDKTALVAMANRNAQSSFEEKRLKEQAQQDVLQEIKEALGLRRAPHRIECFDISTTQGNKTVGSMVVFEGGEATPGRYRRYAIRRVDGQDDFASMREVLLRRYTRAIAEDDLPDLVLIDGGKGQLGVATAVLKDLGVEDLDAAGIAKARAQENGVHSPERFFVPGRSNPILLPQQSPVVLLLARIRDEAHRFAITYHRKRRTKSTVRTALTDIPGVGPARARKLLNQFGSIARIREASEGDIAALPGFTMALASQVKAHLGANGKREQDTMADHAVDAGGD
jgi:excinuclease ABC subunit C